MSSFKLFLSLIFVSCILISCSDDPASPALVVPSAYDTNGYTAATAQQYAFRNALNALMDEADKTRTAGITVSYPVLQNLAAAIPGQKSSYFTTVINTYLEELAKASGTTYDPRRSDNGQGGLFAGYLFDENGLEYGEVVEKLAMGGAIYPMLINYTASNATADDVHRAIAIIGAHYSFPNSYRVSNNPDAFIANYMSRRDKNDGNGLYSSMKKSAIKLQAAIKGKYSNEAAQAAAEFRLITEKAMMATVINYANTAYARFSATAPTDTMLAQGLHSLSEAIGFVNAMKTVQNKVITEVQIEELLGLLLMNKPSDFINNAFTNAPRLLQVIDKLKNIYGFSSLEIEDFKINWVTQQNR
jgi:hypothetical protein